MSNTQGALRYDYEPGYCGEFIASNGTTVCTFTDEPSEANARRLVACWNACDGAPTEWLETNKPVAEIANEIRALRAVNAELVDALTDTIQTLCWLAFGECRNITDRPLITALQAETAGKAALARAKELEKSNG